MKLKRNLARLIRFRLRTLLLLVFLSAIATVGIVRWFESQPIQWTPCTEAVYEKRCQDGRPMILFFGAQWDVSSLLILRVTFEDRQLKRDIRRRGVEMVYADLTSQPPPIMAAVRRLGINTTPTLVFFFPEDVNSPVILRQIISAEEILEVLDTRKNPRRGPGSFSEQGETSARIGENLPQTP